MFQTRHSGSTPNLINISTSNKKWIEKNEAKKIAKGLNDGKFIPSVATMQLYGRKEKPSRFAELGLWISNRKY